MKQKKLLLPLAVAAALIALVIGIVGTVNWWNSTYIKINGTTLRRDITALDLHGQALPALEDLAQLQALESLDLRDTGLTPEQFDTLHSRLPQCAIRWSVPFQDGYLTTDTTQITVTTLTGEDIALLRYLPRLTDVDAMRCRDTGSLAKLIKQYPALRVRLRIPVGSELCDEDTQVLTVENADPFQLDAALVCLRKLKKVTFTGTTPDDLQIVQWKKAYPDITFVWSFDVFGITATSLDTELYLNDIPIESVAAVEPYLSYFYDLQKLELCNCGLPNEELDALWKRHPDTRVIWNVMVGKCNLRTDVTTFMPFKFGYWKGGSITDADAVQLKYCVDMVCMDLGHMKKLTNYDFLAYMPKLQYLLIADTSGTDFSVLSELKELKYLEVFLTTFDQAEVLTGLSQLEDLNLGNTKITNVEPLKKMTWLKNLWLPGCRLLTDGQKLALVDALPNTRVNYYGAGSTGYGWRNLPNYREMRDLLDMPYSEGW